MTSRVISAIGSSQLSASADFRRTIAGLVACALAVLPLRELFTDWGWLTDTWVVMALVLVPAAALRLYSQPKVWHLLPGLLLAVCYLTHRYVPDNAIAGLIPGPGAWKDVAVLDADVRDSIRDDVAPLQSTVAIQMVLAAQAALFAIAIDLIAVVARRPALAGIPFLVIMTVAGAVPRQPVGLVWFAAAAAGYLLLLASDRRDELVRWGRVMPRVAGLRPTPVQALSGRRIGVIAIVAALCVPFLLPIRSVNVVADALHDSGGSGIGDGNGGAGVALDPLAALRGELTRSNPIQLLTVQYVGDPKHNPFYLRQEVLDDYNGKAWTPSGDNQGLVVLGPGLTPDPPSAGPQVTYEAHITVNNTLRGNAPIFASATSLSGLNSASWNPTNQLAVTNRVNKNTTYTEAVSETQPTTTDLTVAGEVLSPEERNRLTQVGGTVPSAVDGIVSSAVGTATSDYEKARAIFGYFVAPGNHFTYSTTTKSGTSGSDLLDFLTNRVGFCQQYAAAMAVMLRIAQIPSRVVIGYTHRSPDENGQFTVTTLDAHAWVEAYFGGAGWVPFDPTPLQQQDPRRAATLAWAPHPQSASVSDPGTAVPRVSNSPGQTAGLGAASAAPGSSSGSGGLGWLFWTVLAVVIFIGALFVTPAAVRLRRRRARLRAARAGPDPLWAELADTATDLGYVWSPVRTPRQVEGWLREEAVSGSEAEAALHSLATAVEVSRYAPPSSRPPAETDLVSNLREVEASLRARRTRSDRVRARMLPGSVSWLRRRLRGH
jgi:transglutaminase-like putative cysteine protease